MNINNITECADFLFGPALYKCGNTADAQDLVQDTLLAALSAKKPISDPKAWLTAVLNRKYYGLLRRKYNKPAVSYELIGDIPENGEVYDNIELSADKYPERPNGGSWFAFGNRYPANYDYSSPAHEYGKYCISGEARYRHSVDCVGMKKHELTLCEYNSLLGEAQIGDCGKLKRRMEEVEIGQMLYAIHSGKEEQLPLINAGCFENFDIFIEKRYLARDGERVVCDVPVITDRERHELYGLCERYDKIIAEKFHGEFIKLLKNPVKIPAHLKSVPGWFRYMWHCNSLPMLIAEKARDSGLFPECEDCPAPAMLLSANE